MRTSQCSIYSLKLKILQWAHAQRSKEVHESHNAVRAGPIVVLTQPLAVSGVFVIFVARILNRWHLVKPWTRRLRAASD